MSKNLEKIVKIFLLSSPFLDILTAVCIRIFHLNLTVGIFVRFLFLFYALFYCFFVYQGKSKKKIVGLLTLLLCYLLFFFINIFIEKGEKAFFYEAKNAIKTFYFPFLLLFFSAILEEKKDVVPRRYFLYLSLSYLLGIFLPNLLGLGFDSYEVTKEGGSGFFLTANEVGGIISLLMPFFLYALYQEKNLLKVGGGFLILVYVLLSIGTKGPLLSFFLIGTCWFLIFLVNLYKRKSYQKLTLLLISVLILAFSFLLLLPHTSFYKNIRVHLDFLEVDHITDVFKDEKLLDHFVFSSRLGFIDHSAKYYKKASITDHLLGIGYVESYGTDQIDIKMVEMDYVDIFFRHGVLGFFLYMSIFLSAFFKAIKKVWQEKDFGMKVCFYLSYSLVLLLSFFTGHILSAPSVSIIVILLLLLPNKKGEIL